MQSASYIIEIRFQDQEIVEIFEHFNKRQSSTFSKVQDSSFSINSRERTNKEQQTQTTQHINQHKYKTTTNNRDHFLAFSTF